MQYAPRAQRVGEENLPYSIIINYWYYLDVLAIFYNSIGKTKIRWQMQENLI